MLKLFKNITDELTDLEKNEMVPILVDTLSRSSHTNIIKGKHLCGLLQASRYTVSEARVRKMVNYIRVLNLMSPNVLIGTSQGYFITNDPHVIDDQIESLQGRIDSTEAVIDSIKAQRLNLTHLKVATA